MRRDHGDELDGVDVEDVLGLGVVAELLVVARKAQHVADAQGVGAEDVALHGEAVAVAADHLDNWAPGPPGSGSALAAELDMRTTAVWLSVMLTASTTPLRWAAFFTHLLDAGCPGADPIRR